MYVKILFFHIFHEKDENGKSTLAAYLIYIYKIIMIHCISYFRYVDAKHYTLYLTLTDWLWYLIPDSFSNISALNFSKIIIRQRTVLRLILFRAYITTGIGYKHFYIKHFVVWCCLSNSYNLDLVFFLGSVTNTSRA